MLKMLRHDLKSVWKVWRILAPLAVLAGIVGGIAVRMLDIDFYDNLPMMTGLLLQLTSRLVSLYWPMILTAFVMVTLILIVVRYYKNFFTDEGYLTFTLPVSRTQLLNSKILMAFIWLAATAVVCVIAYVAFILITEVGTPGFDPGIDTDPSAPVEEDPIFGEYGMLVFLLELIVLVIVAPAADVLLLLLCVTLGAVIVKRAKLVLGLGLYYGLNTAVGVAIYLFFIGMMIMLVAMVDAANEETVLTLARLAIYGTPAVGIVLFGALGVGSYFINLKLIKQKLNLP